MILVEWPILEVHVTHVGQPIPVALGVATTFFPTAAAMPIARPTAVGNRRAAAAGPAAGHRLQTLTATILLASVAQVARRIIVGAVGAPGADDGKFERPI